jgi:hypothetical protein
VPLPGRNRFAATQSRCERAENADGELAIPHWSG